MSNTELLLHLTSGEFIKQASLYREISLLSDYIKCYPDVCDEQQKEKFDNIYTDIKKKFEEIFDEGAQIESAVSGSSYVKIMSSVQKVVILDIPFILSEHFNNRINTIISNGSLTQPDPDIEVQSHEIIELFPGQIHQANNYIETMSPGDDLDKMLSLVDKEFIITLTILLEIKFVEYLMDTTEVCIGLCDEKRNIFFKLMNYYQIDFGYYCGIFPEFDYLFAVLYEEGIEMLLENSEFSKEIMGKYFSISDDQEYIDELSFELSPDYVKSILSSDQSFS